MIAGSSQGLDPFASHATLTAPHVGVPVSTNVFLVLRISKSWKVAVWKTALRIPTTPLTSLSHVSHAISDARLAMVRCGPSRVILLVNGFFLTMSQVSVYNFLGDFHMKVHPIHSLLRLVSVFCAMKLLLK